MLTLFPSLTVSSAARLATTRVAALSAVVFLLIASLTKAAGLVTVVSFEAVAGLSFETAMRSLAYAYGLVYEEKVV
jgi:hypothetical protein